MSALLILALTACKPGTDDTAADVVDLRGDFPDPPEGGIQYRTPDMTIEPYSETQWCFFDTYEGDDVGITDVETWQSEYGHHVQLMSTDVTTDQFADGEAFDCTDRDTLPMTDMNPIYIGAPEAAGHASMHLPDGMAAQYDDGTRIVIQSHYLNTSADRILVHDAVNLTVVDPDTVETWAAPFAHTLTEMPIPAGQETTLKVDCTFDQDFQILYLGGHMHQWGTRFSLDWDKGDGDVERIYEVDPWDVSYRDQPPVTSYDNGEMSVTAGQTFETSCTWYNDTDEELNFPEEMCVTFGMLYPSKVPQMCDPS